MSVYAPAIVVDYKVVIEKGSQAEVRCIRELERNLNRATLSAKLIKLMKEGYFNEEEKDELFCYFAQNAV